jgi:hypothetical protein
MGTVENSASEMANLMTIPNRNSIFQYALPTFLPSDPNGESSGKMKIPSSIFFICLFGPVLSYAVLSNVGCVRSRPLESFARSDVHSLGGMKQLGNTPQGPLSISRELESAQAEAIIAVFNRTTVLEHLRDNFGAVFFQGVSSNALNEVNRRIGGKLPQLRGSLQGLDLTKWVDKETGKRAMLVEAQTVSSDARAPVFRITTRIYNRGGNMCRAEMKKVDDAWQLAGFEVLIAD